MALFCLFQNLNKISIILNLLLKFTKKIQFSIIIFINDSLFKIKKDDQKLKLGHLFCLDGSSFIESRCMGDFLIYKAHY